MGKGLSNAEYTKFWKEQMMAKETINVNGKRMNKMEEIVKLLKKLNEEMYTEEQREELGYPISVVIRADGSGRLEQGNYPERLYQFVDLAELEEFLKAGQLSRLAMVRMRDYQEFAKVKGQ